MCCSLLVVVCFRFIGCGACVYGYWLCLYLVLLGKVVVVLVVHAVCGGCGGTCNVRGVVGIHLHDGLKVLFCPILVVMDGECTVVLWNAFICMC